MRRRSTRRILVESYTVLIGMGLFILLSPLILYYGGVHGTPGSAGVSPWIPVATIFLVGVPFAIWCARRQSASSADELVAQHDEPGADSDPRHQPGNETP